MTDNFTLRAFKDSDAEDFVKGINTDTIARDTTISLPCSLDSARWWISFITEAANKTPIREKHFVIEVEGKLAGSIAIINIDKHKGEIGYWLVDKYKGKNIVSRALKELIDYGINELKMVRLFAPVLSHNKASIRVLEKNGFKQEARLEKYYLKDGKYIDALSYVLV